MSRLINPDDYVKISTYSEKYAIYKKKLYRYIESNSIDHIMMDGIPFIKDVDFETLISKTNENVSNKNVKKLTNLNKSVNFLTHENHNNTDNQELNDVKKLTNPNVKKLTLKKRLKEIEDIPELQRSLSELEEIDRIYNELNKI